MGVSTDQAPVVKAIIVVAIVTVQSPVFRAWISRINKQKPAEKEVVRV